MRATLIIVLACLAGAASAAKQVTLSPPPSISSSPPPPSAVTPPTPTFLTPGIVFSVVLPNVASSTFGTASQAAFAAGITNALQGPGFTSNVTFTSASTFNGTSTLVNGFAATRWSATPTVTALSQAASIRDGVIVSLTNNLTTILGPAFPGAYPNIACLGVAQVTQFSGVALSYSTNVTNPGPVQCGARLTYANTAAATLQVGVDDGTGIASNRGKYCSTPAVTGGVVGVPSIAGPCRVYGVIASASGTNQASVVGNQVTLTSGAVTAITTGGTGSAGSGYTSVPTVTISAPSPLPAQVSVSVTSAGVSTLNIVATPNGPYSGARVLAETFTGNCFSTDATCNGPSITITGLTTTGAAPTNTGPQCTLANFNALPGLGAAPGILTVTAATGVLTVGSGIPASWRCDPTAPPTITLSTATLQPAVTATATATIDTSPTSATFGTVTAIVPTSGGSGYLFGAQPTVTISAPTATNIGKLCSGNPISGISADIAVALAVPGGVTASGQCQPLGIDTFYKSVCSVPAAPGGLWSPVNGGTCNVFNSFIAQPGSTTTYSAGIVAQSFTTTISVAPAPPPSTTGPSPALPPTSPSPATYRGRFQFGSVACKGKFLAASAGCGDRSVLLRTVSQSKGSRTFWAIDGTAGVATGVASVVRVGRCNGNNNLASAQSTPTPVIGGGSWKVKISPVDAANPSVVTIEATDKTYKGKFLQVGDKCDDQKGFSWAAKTSSTGQQWQLLAVSNA